MLHHNNVDILIGASSSMQIKMHFRKIKEMPGNYLKIIGSTSFAFVICYECISFLSKCAKLSMHLIQFLILSGFCVSIHLISVQSHTIPFTIFAFSMVSQALNTEINHIQSNITSNSKNSIHQRMCTKHGFLYV